MGAQPSKDILLYQQVSDGNVEVVKALHRDGAGLEWIDSERNTPLMLACSWPDLIDVAKVLIELGADVNAYRPGSHAGTALHHAAKRGLYQTVNLLLSSGANPFVIDEDCHTPLDLARSNGHCNVVRAMESALADGVPVPIPDGPGPSGGPSMLNPVASTIRPSSSSPQLHNSKLETTTVVPPSHEAPPAVTVVPSAPPIDEFFFNKPVQYPTMDSTPVDLHMPDVGMSEDKKNGSGGSGLGLDSGTCAICFDAPVEGACVPCRHMAGCMSCLVVPSAPPIDEFFFNKPVQYPTMDSTPVDLNLPDVGMSEGKKNGSGGSGLGSDSGTCAICLDAPMEGACVPCGHMAGCMSCLNDIKRKSWGCPVCRAEINHVLRVYAL